MKRTVQNGTLSISKTHSSDNNYVSIKFRLDDRSVTAEVSLTDFADILLGKSDVNCLMRSRLGGAHGTGRGVIHTEVGA